MTQSPLHTHTPLVESYPLGKLMGCRVWLKLDNLQPVDSFKIRGIGNRVQKEFARGKKRVVTASGGNAGLAAAFAARKLGMSAKIFVPETTAQYMRDRIAGEGAEVIVHGKVYNEANDRASQEATDPEVALIHAYDNPDVWEGHESLIQEVHSDIPVKPGLVVTVVGGGGLLVGIRQGMEKVGWQDVPVLAMETDGANCFRAATEAGHPVTIPDITSIAKTLGSLRVADRTFELYQKGNVISGLVSDKQAIDACSRFADDHRMLVEPSCGAGLAAAYSGVIKQLQQDGRLPAELSEILLVVCGGHCITMEMLEGWKKQFGVH